MKVVRLALTSWVVLILVSCSRKIIPEKPTLTGGTVSAVTAPESNINIPIQINLQPFYAEAERLTDTVYTSPNWPNDWVEADCATRYKYHFRRGPFRISSVGNSMNLDFTGYYRIIGSTRGCIGQTVVSPWTPGCRCGFDEGERRVQVSFKNTVSVLPDYRVLLSVQRLEPRPVDRCSVCFWGQDITGEVMKGLAAELDLAKKAIEDSFGVVNLRPRFQELWNRLNDVYNLYGMGWLQINPTRLRINNLFARNDSLFLFVGLSARPAVSFEKPGAVKTLLPDLDRASADQGFSVFLDGHFNYDSLSSIANNQLSGKRFDLEQGMVKKKYIIIRHVDLYGTDHEKLIIRVEFDGSESGIFYLTGRPVYDPARQVLEMRDLDFDVKTRDLLVRTARWLFNRKIVNELREQTRFDLSAYVDTAKLMMNRELNREWTTGIRSFGRIDELGIDQIYPAKDHLLVRSKCSGYLVVRVDSLDFSL